MGPFVIFVGDVTSVTQISTNVSISRSSEILVSGSRTWFTRNDFLEMLLCDTSGAASEIAEGFFENTEHWSSARVVNLISDTRSDSITSIES